MEAFRISAAAEEDIASIAAYTLEHYGAEALDRYLNLIETGLLNLSKDPNRLGVRSFEGAIYRYHLASCRDDAGSAFGRVHLPRHVIFFQVGNDGIIEVIRLLHDSMDFGRHLGE